MQQPVNRCHCSAPIPEQFVPLIEGSIWDQQIVAPFIAVRAQPENYVGFRLILAHLGVVIRN